MRQFEPYSLMKLPPDLAKVESVAVLRQTAIAAAALAELKGLAKTIPNQSILINAVVLQESKDSSEIENIITTNDELYRAITTNISQISAATKEVINYRKALFYGYDTILNQGFIRIDDILNIQKLLVNNDAGLRKLPGTVLKNDKTGEIVFNPPQNYDDIFDLLGNFIEYFNGDFHEVSPLISMAILHYQFESIHPFYDGNGRTGRILNIIYMILNKLLDSPILYLSSYIIKHKSEYYRLLNQTNYTGEWENWILFMLEAIEKTSLNTINKINNINELMQETRHIIKSKLPKIYSKELVELIFENPYSKIDFVVQKLSVERKAASRYLSELENIGILNSHKFGREKLFINTKLIQVLQNI